MKQFFAALAMVSALLIAAKADESDKWCDLPAEAAVEQIAPFLAQGLPVEALNEHQTQAYLRAARSFVEIPVLLGITMVVAEVPGKGARGFLFKGDKYCARLTLPWASHVHAMKKAKGSGI